jgi:asparagine synthase (glutamine-hydrolysing)
MEDLLAPARVRGRGLFVPAAVEALKREHQERQRGHADRLFALMMLELWMRAYVDGEAVR